MRGDLDLILKQYLAAYPDESDRLAGLTAFFDTNAPADRFRRDNFAGHVTASGIVIDPARRRVLLIHHAFLDCWLQPGGHVDADDDTLVAAALREIEEETGLAAGALTLMNGGAGEGGAGGGSIGGSGTDEATAMPIDIDSHEIPARPARNEAAHVHHDFRYLFTMAEPLATSAAADASEIHASRWFDLSALGEATSARLLDRVQRSIG